MTRTIDKKPMMRLMRTKRKMRARHTVHEAVAMPSDPI
jgi:hypothetical protein